MPELDDQIRAWVDRAAPITPDEVRRAAGEPPNRQRPVRLLIAAAIVVVVGAVALVWGVGGDDDRVRTTDLPPEGGPSTTEPSDPVVSTTPTSAPSPPSVAGSPPRFVAHSADRTLVVVDADTGAVIRTLVEFDDPQAPTPDGEPAGMGRYLGAMDLSPDGETVYYETCCEPAVGEIWRIPVAGGEPERVVFGTDPAISPDGTKLAFVELQGLTVIDLARESVERRQIPIDGDLPMLVANPAWSPDGTMLAFERYGSSLEDGSVLVTTFDDRGVPVSSADVLADADAGPGDGGGRGVAMFPSFDAEGNLHVVRQDRRLAEGPLEAVGRAWAEVYDPTDGTLLARDELAMAVRSSSFSPDGTGRLVVWSDGSVVTGASLDGAAARLSVFDATW